MATDSVKNVCLSILEELESIDEFKNTLDFNSNLKHFKDRLTDDEFRIAVVGEFSSGKSTFLNAIIGQDVLSHAVTETTAAITRIVNVAPSDKRCGTGKVLLQNGEAVTLNHYRDLIEYTTKYSTNYNVVTDIALVELYVPVLGTDANVVFIDTPGLNGNAEGHRERTIELIQQAHACIYLLQLRGLSQSDETFIQYLSRYQKNFIFVLNFIDELQRMEGECLEDKLQAQRRILTDRVFIQNDNIHFEICGVSALLALTYADKRIKRLYSSSLSDLTEDRRNQLWEESNFDSFQQILKSTLRDENRMRIQYQDTALALYGWINDLCSILENRTVTYQEVYESSKDYRSIKKQQDLHDKLKSNCKKREENLTDHIISTCKDISKSEAEGLSDALQNLHRELNKIIDQHNAIDSLETWAKRLPLTLDNMLALVFDNHHNRLRWHLQNLYQRLIQRIEEYSGMRKEDLQYEAFSIQAPKKPVHSFKREDAIAQDKKEIALIKEKEDAAMQEVAKARSEQQDAEREVAWQESLIALAAAHRAAQIHHLGDKPQPGERWVTYTDYEERCWLLSWLGPKRVTRMKLEPDYSNVDAWKNKKIEIENAYTEEIARRKEEKNDAERKRDRLKIHVDESSKRLQDYQNTVAQKEKALRKQEELLKKEKEEAALHYLKIFKKSLDQQLRSYLLSADNSILRQIQSNMNTELEQTKVRFTRMAIELYHQALDQRLKQLEAAIQQKTPALLRQKEQLAVLLERLTIRKKEMEDIINGESI